MTQILLNHLRVPHRDKSVGTSGSYMRPGVLNNLANPQTLPGDCFSHTHVAMK